MVTGQDCLGLVGLLRYHGRNFNLFIIIDSCEHPVSRDMFIWLVQGA